MRMVYKISLHEKEKKDKILTLRWFQKLGFICMNKKILFSHFDFIYIFQIFFFNRVAPTFCMGVNLFPK